MMFKKGSFEIGATIYPVAIKVLQSCLFFQAFWLTHLKAQFLTSLLKHIFVYNFFS